VTCGICGTLLYERGVAGTIDDYADGPHWPKACPHFVGMRTDDGAVVNMGFSRAFAGFQPVEEGPWSPLGLEEVGPYEVDFPGGCVTYRVLAFVTVDLEFYMTDEVVEWVDQDRSAPPPRRRVCPFPISEEPDWPGT